MPPRWPSRHMFCYSEPDDDGVLRLSERNPYRFRIFADTITHIVRDGDTLWNLAARYYSGFDRPAGLWWVIADFQPDGKVYDPTIRLKDGDMLLVPSPAVVEHVIFSDERRSDPDP